MSKEQIFQLYYDAMEARREAKKQARIAAGLTTAAMFLLARKGGQVSKSLEDGVAVVLSATATGIERKFVSMGQDPVDPIDADEEAGIKEEPDDQEIS